MDRHRAPVHAAGGEDVPEGAHRHGERRADGLLEGTWTPPTSFHTDLLRERAAGHIFNTIANGIRNMPAYGSQIPVEDRWAIVAYVRALQRSQNATVDDVPPEIRAQLR